MSADFLDGKGYGVGGLGICGQINVTQSHCELAGSKPEMGFKLVQL